MPDVMKNQSRSMVDNSISRHENVSGSKGKKTTLIAQSRPWL